MPAPAGCREHVEQDCASKIFLDICHSVITHSIHLRNIYPFGTEMVRKRDECVVFPDISSDDAYAGTGTVRQAVILPVAGRACKKGRRNRRAAVP